jgi:hypothetical protein
MTLPRAFTFEHSLKWRFGDYGSTVLAVTAAAWPADIYHVPPLPESVELIEVTSRRTGQDLAPYLSDARIEELTEAAETAWRKLVGDPDDLRFIENMVSRRLDDAVCK